MRTGENKTEEGRSPVPYKENSIESLPVVRLASFGAFLSGGTGDSSDDILLHKDQQTEEVHEGDEVRVFLYHDPRGRLTASMRLPQIQIGEPAYTEVLLTTRFGAFVEAGTERGIFLPFSEMIGQVRAGQKIWVRMYEDKTGRLAMTMHVDQQIRDLSVPARGIKVGGKVEGTVYNQTGEGVFMITRERWIGFFHHSEIRGPIEMGQPLTGRVTYIRPDGRLDLSLREQKEKVIASDTEKVIAYMEQSGGTMDLTDSSSPEDIRRALDLSKAAFKRAAGHLLKEKKIAIEPSCIKILQKKEKKPLGTDRP